MFDDCDENECKKGASPRNSGRGCRLFERRGQVRGIFAVAGHRSGYMRGSSFTTAKSNICATLSDLNLLSINFL